MMQFVEAKQLQTTRTSKCDSKLTMIQMTNGFKIGKTEEQEKHETGQQNTLEEGT